jgi:hypothetical protein
MGLSKEEFASEARADLARRLDVDAENIQIEGIDDAEFPNGSLGAPVEGEMTMMMITPGWKIRLACDGKTYEYRAAGDQLRVYDLDGQNYVVE